MKTLTLKQIIALLNAYKNKYGDMLVIHQTDPEGNGFGTIHPDSICCGDTSKGKALFIAPFEENIEEELF